jgi:hypothetical protein
MNKITALSCLILTSTVFVNSLHAQAGSKKQENLIPNGSFETDTNVDGHADHWFVHPATQQAVEGGEVACIQKGAAEGYSFLRVKKTGGTISYMVSNGMLDTPTLLSVKDKPLLLRAKVRGVDLEGSPGVALMVFARKKGQTGAYFSGQIAATPKATPGANWVVIETRFRLSDLLLPGEELARTELVLQVPSNTGHADFDDVALIVLP